MLYSIKTNDCETKSILTNIFSIVLIKGGSVVVSLLTLPLYMRYFDNAISLGLWFTILSVLNWFLSFDLGIGNGLRNILTQTFEKNDNIASKQYISSAYVIVASFSFLFFITSLLIIPHIDLNTLLNIPLDMVSAKTLTTCVIIVFSGIMLQLTLNTISSVFYAMQKSAVINLMSLLSSTLILLYVKYSPAYGIETDIINLSIVNTFFVNIPLVLVTIFIFSKILRECSPSIFYFKKEYAKKVLSLGLIFFVLQFMVVLIGNTNEFLISHFTYPANVQEYTIYYKIYNIFISLFNLLLIPIWSAATKQQVRNNFNWLKKLHKILLIGAILTICLNFLIAPFLQFIVDLWIGKEHSVTIYWQYSILFSISTGLMIWNGANCSLANGLGWLKAQLVFLSFGAILNIPIAIILTKASGLWISIILANIISLLPICIIQPIYIHRKIIIERNKINEGAN